jgi:hypothetical protein
MIILKSYTLAKYLVMTKEEGRVVNLDYKVWVMSKVKTMEKITVLPFSIFFFLLPNFSFSQNANKANSPKADSINIQKVDSTKKDFYLKATVNLTNKGISYIPNFSIGKPAIIVDFSMGGRRLFFEPQFRFSLNGEPWAFLFPLRYKILNGKFQLIAAVNPLMNFKNVTYVVDGVSTTDLVNRRYLGGELKPNYFISKNISVGASYLYFLGVSRGALKNTNFASINANFSHIKFGAGFFTKINMQIYYLNQDGKDGFYFSPTVILLKNNFPLSIQSIMNAAIRSNIPGSQKFIWNISLIYSFNKAYTEK